MILGALVEAKFKIKLDIYLKKKLCSLPRGIRNYYMGQCLIFKHLTNLKLLFAKIVALILGISGYYAKC